MTEPKRKPDHYKTICISIYMTDLAQANAKVAELKRRGRTKMSLSELIRIALAQLDVSALAPGHDEAVRVLPTAAP